MKNATQHLSAVLLLLTVSLPSRSQPKRVADIPVQPGDFCKAGTPLGAMGRTGINAARSRSPTHLHLMVLNAQNAQLPPIGTWKFLAGSEF